MTALSGFLTALVGYQELRLSLRSPILSRIFASYMLFVLLLWVPSTAYFYIFYGDWSLAYCADASRIPSAIALLVFVGQALLAAFTFRLGVSMLRAYRRVWTLVTMGSVAVLTILAVLLASARWMTVGTFAQFHGGFGTVPLYRSSVLLSAIILNVLVGLGYGFLLYRLGFGTFSRRSEH